MSGRQYKAVNDRAVRVTGRRWVPSEMYTVRLEGAALVGYRSVAFAGVRDPLVLRQVDRYLEDLSVVVEKKVNDNLRLKRDQYVPHLRVYGRNGPLRRIEPGTGDNGHEVGR